MPGPDGPVVVQVGADRHAEIWFDRAAGCWRWQVGPVYRGGRAGSFAQALKRARHAYKPRTLARRAKGRPAGRGVAPAGLGV